MPVLGQRFEPHFLEAICRPPLDPIRPATRRVFAHQIVRRHNAAHHRLRVAAQPALADLVLVVLGEGDKVVAMFLEPGSDALREIAAVAPEGVHVQVASSQR